MTDRELRTYLPFMGIHDGVVLSKRGDITFGWTLTLPTAFTVNEAGYDSIIMSFLQAYKLLPPYCIIHKQDVYCFDVYRPKESKYFLGRSFEEHLKGRRFLTGNSHIYLTFSNKTNIERKNSSSGFFGIGSGRWASAEHIIECARYASQFESVLKNNSFIGVKAMTTDDFLCEGPNGEDKGVISDFLNLYRMEGPDYDIEFQKDHIQYGDEQLRIWSVEDSDAYQALVSSVCKINDMSSGAANVFLSGGSPIGFHLRIPHVVNRYIVTLPHAVVENELDSKRRTMSSFSLYSAKDAVNSQEIAGYLLASAKESATTVKCHMNLMAWGPDSKMRDIANMVTTAFASNLKVRVVEERRVAPLLHYAAIPGAAAELGYDNYLTSEITAFCCHGLWDGYDRGIKGGIIKLCDRETMTPVTIDLQEVARKKNLISVQNFLVVGPSGSGKSFTMNKLVQDMYEAGEHIFIIDVGDSYQGYAQIVAEESNGQDGVYNTYDPEHPYGFNPFKNFRHWNDVDEDGEKVNSGYDFFLSILKTIYQPEGGWNKESSSVLKFVVSQFLSWWENGVPSHISDDLRDAWMNECRRRAERNHRRFDEESSRAGFRDPVVSIFRDADREKDPLFDDFYQYVTRIVVPLMRDENFKMGEIFLTFKLLDTERLSAAMDMYKQDGIYGFLLNAVDEPDLFKSRLTIFEVDKIKDNQDIFPLWVLLIMHSFEDKMRSLPCQKVMIIEEAWKAIATETMAEFIVWMWRTARKFSTSAVVVTQDILDLTGSPIIRDAIIVNSPVRILLDQRSNVANFEKGAEVLALSEKEKNLVLSVNTSLHPGFHYKEVFISIGPSYSNVFAVEVSPEQRWAFESNKVIKAPLLRRAAECGSMIRAIEETVESERKGLK